MLTHKNLKNKEPRLTKIDLNQLVVDNNCLILEEGQIVQVQQIEVASAEAVVLLPAPVPLLQSL